MLGRMLFAGAFTLGFVLPVLAETPSPPAPQKITTGVWLIPGGIPAGREPDGNTIVLDAAKPSL